MKSGTSYLVALILEATMMRTWAVLILAGGLAMPATANSMSYDQLVDACGAGDVDVDRGGSSSTEQGKLDSI
jgi:hypothetical protein